MKKTQAEIDKLELKNTRKSKSQAGNLRNGAWAAYLQQTSIHKQLAMACLKSPSATVHTLLQAWARYMHSEEHEREKARAKKNKPEDEEAVNEKNFQVDLKMKVHSLRHQLREMRRDNTAKNIQRNMS